jgi:hypothetical protein
LLETLKGKKEEKEDKTGEMSSSTYDLNVRFIVYGWSNY